MVMVVRRETPAPGDFDLRYGRPRSRCTVRNFAKKSTSKTGFEPGSLSFLYKDSNREATTIESLYKKDNDPGSNPVLEVLFFAKFLTVHREQTNKQRFKYDEQ